LAIMVAAALKKLLAGESIDNTRQFSSDICARLDQARKIVADFLDITQAGAGQTKLEPTESDLQVVISEVVQALSQQAVKQPAIR